MNVYYKINDRFVPKKVYREYIIDQNKLLVWDRVLFKMNSCIRKTGANVIFKMEDNEIRIITETKLLYALYAEYLKLMTSAIVKQNRVIA
jgi:hypothetical protein